MKRDILYKEVLSTQKQAFELMKKKNADYASDEDALKNFRFAELIGFPTRMGDKVSRLQQIIKSGKVHVKSESIEDTLLDLSNYCHLMMAYIKDTK